MPTLRLPHNGSRWVWEIDKPHARCLIEVTETKWNGEEWWVTARVLPDFRSADGTPKGKFWNELDRFWEAVTSVGGRLEDLSNPISESQYKPMKHERA